MGATLVSIWRVPSPSPPLWKIWDECARTGKKIYRDYIAKRFTASKSRGKSLQRKLIWFSKVFTALRCCSVLISNAWLFVKKIYREHKIKLLFESMLAVNLFKPIEKTLTTASEDCPTERTNLPVKGWVSIDRSMVTALLSTTPRQVPRSSTDDSVLKTSRYVNSGCNSNGECKPDSPRMLCHQVMGCVEKDNSSTVPDWPKPVEQ